MANPGFQVTNHGFQGVGQFGFQTEQVVVVTQRPGGSSRRKRRITKLRIREIPPIPNTIIVEVPPPQPYLQQILFDMEKAGFDFVETEEEDDALVLTFILKSIQ